MPSPFPGMDPYLEQFWGDIHARLVTYACDQIQGRLPRDLRARMQERLFVALPDDTGRDIIPDVRVVERFGPGSGGGVAVAEPEVSVAQAAEPLLYLRDDPETETFIEIVEPKAGDRLVTVIEILSPSNKHGKGRDKYDQKRRELDSARISLVEIDLLRDGVRELGDAHLRLTPKGHATYQACVHRGWGGIKYEIYPMPIRERLPAIRIPLRPSDRDVVLDLQALIDQCYANGRYEQTNYAIALDPPLDAEDVAWAEGVLKDKGLR